MRKLNTNTLTWEYADGSGEAVPDEIKRYAIEEKQVADLFRDAKKDRRAFLPHESSCPMRKSVYRNCNCHYDDCLNYSDGYRNCICNELTARTRHAQYWVWRLSLPTWKRVVVWSRKPYAPWSEFMNEAAMPQKRLWY